MTWAPGVALVCALYGLLVGQLVPTLIARIPEPEAEPGPGDGAATGGGGTAQPGADAGVESPGSTEHTGSTASTASTGSTGSTGSTPSAGALEADAPPPEPPGPPGMKELYVDIARRRGLRAGAALASAGVAAVIGGAVGWSPALTFLLYLVPVGVALAVVDWRTRRLPTKVIAPSYVVVGALAVVAAWAEGDPSRLVGAALGWAVAGGLFFALWFVYPRGMGYGDVRLSGILGIALGYLGWSEVVVGVWSGFLLGGVGGLLLSTLRVVDRRAYPFGPFMLAGAVVGIALGPYVAAWYA